ncbi:hypothetical protein L7F22_018684 [Adiantum nelumboides]|nr:hypothetical protein [Adiantum nelumboides]
MNLEGTGVQPSSESRKRLALIDLPGDYGSVSRRETERTGATCENVVDAAAIGHESCKAVEGNSLSIVNALPKCPLGITQADAAAAHVLCKPPLSPMHSKLGLPPRPRCQKVSGHHLTSKVVSLAHGPGRGSFHELAFDNQPSGQMQTTPAAVVFDVQNRELARHGKATFVRFGSSFQNSKVVEGSMSGSAWHSTALADNSSGSPKMDNGGISSKEQPRTAVCERGSASATPGQHVGNGCNVTAGRMLEDVVGEPVCTNGLSSTPSVDLQLKFAVSGTETSKNASMMLAASLELPKSTLHRSITEGGFHLGKRKVDEQVVKASTSATLPWELFVEPAGASKKVREQFVEVYNRARDELKNQRLSQSTNRTLCRELDGGPKLTLGPTGASSDVRVEWQYYNQGGEFSGSRQSQGTNTMLEHQIRPSSLKEPTVMTAADSSQCKQVEGFRRVHSVLEVPLRLSHKTVVGEGNMEVSSQRTSEGSIIHGKESKGPDNECPSNPVSDGKNSVLKLGKDVKSAGLHQNSRDQKELNGQKAVPVLGKRSRVTFEDQTMSLGAEKGAASRPRPQIKPHLWLQRWHSTSKHNSNGLSADTQVTPDGKRNDFCSYRTLGLKKFKDEDGMGVFGQGVNSIDRVKFLKTNSSKVLPSAAAMAIVGTAARQFCSSHPQGKGSFAFWSGFGMPLYGKVESVLENGKGQVFLKANENLPSS